MERYGQETVIKTRPKEKIDIRSFAAKNINTGIVTRTIG
jgi:hypothetical protein